MSWFSRKRKMNNEVATAVQPTPGPTTIHNHSTSWPGVIFAGFLCAVALLPLTWYILVFLFDQMGSANPRKDAAFWIVAILFAIIGIYLLNWFLPRYIDSWFNFKLEVEKEVTRREEVRLLAVQTAIEPGRMNEADYEFARVVLAVMQNAYSFLDRQGYVTFPGRARPWSKSAVLETADKIGIKITQDRALSVSKWLADRGVITSPDLGQIAPAFPDLSNVRAMLDREFGKPIQLVSPTLRVNRGFKFTE